MATAHPVYPFLHVFANGETFYESTGPGDLADFLRLARDHPDVVATVNHVVLRADHDSGDSSEVVEWVEGFGIDVAGEGSVAQTEYESGDEEVDEEGVTKYLSTAKPSGEHSDGPNTRPTEDEGRSKSFVDVTSKPDNDVVASGSSADPASVLEVSETSPLRKDMKRSHDEALEEDDIADTNKPVEKRPKLTAASGDDDLTPVSPPVAASVLLPINERFLKVAEDFEATKLAAAVDDVEPIPEQMYLNLLAGLLHAAVPGVRVFVLPSVWVERFDVTAFHNLGVVVMR